MRIALLSDPGNFHTRKWVSALIEAGAEVHVFSFNDCGHQEFGWTRIRAPWPMGGRLNYLFYLMGGAALGRVLKRFSPDCVVALNVTPFGVWAMKSGFKPWIAVAMGADILAYLPTSPSNETNRGWSNTTGKRWSISRLKESLLKPLYKRWVKKALRSAQHVTADNLVLTQAMQDVFDVPSEKITLNRWGIRPELFEADPSQPSKTKARYFIPEGNKVILSPRGLNAFYHADLIAEGYLEFLGESSIPSTLIMLGAGYPSMPQTSEWQQSAKSKGGRILVIEEILSPQEMADLWQIVDVFISAPTYDGYSSSVAEGRYAGCIPVVNPIQGNLEIIQHLENGWICQPFTAGQLGKDLNSILLCQEELKRRFADKNKKWIEENSLLKPQAKAFLEMIQKIILLQSTENQA